MSENADLKGGLMWASDIKRKGEGSKTTNDFCIMAMADEIHRLQNSLTQARDELERYKTENETQYRNIASLQAKLAAAESKLRDNLQGVGTICLIHNSEACAECVADLRKAESQAAELREKLEWAANNGGPWINNVITTFLASLPASVQARAEREAARDAVIEAAEQARQPAETTENIDACRRLDTALARLAALDSAQKGERR